MNIIIYGDKKDTSLFEMLEQTFSSKLHVSTMTSDQINLFPKSKLSIIDTDNLTNIDTKNSILILKHKCNIKQIKNINENSIIIVDSNNKSQLSQLSKLSLQNVKVITVGLYEKDTVTFSSINEDDCIVTLQRSLNFFNTTIEPLDYPLNKKDFNTKQNYLILSYATILIFMENSDI